MNSIKLTCPHAKKIIIWSICEITLIALLYVSPVSSSQVKNLSCEITYNPSNNTMSANLNEIHIKDVVKTLSAETSITIFLDKSISHKVSAKFSNLSLEDGIKRLLGPVNSAFVFVKEVEEKGKINYRAGKNLDSAFVYSKSKSSLEKPVYKLDTIKIFAEGKLMSADYMKFNKEGSKQSGLGNSHTALSNTPLASVGKSSGLKENLQKSILAAKENIELIKRKNLYEVNMVKQKIAKAHMEMSRKLTPEQRGIQAKKIFFARQELDRIINTNNRIILDEQQNLRSLTASAAISENRSEGSKKIMERQQQSQQMRAKKILEQ